MKLSQNNDFRKLVRASLLQEEMIDTKPHIAETPGSIDGPYASPGRFTNQEPNTPEHQQYVEVAKVLIDIIDRELKVWGKKLPPAEREMLLRSISDKMVKALETLNLSAT